MLKISSGMPNFSIIPFRTRGLQTKKNGNHKVCINDVVYYYRTDNINSYNHNISEKNLLSYFKSTRHLIDFFEKYDTANTYRRAIDIGVVNAYRWARNAKIKLRQSPLSLIQKIVGNEIGFTEIPDNQEIDSAGNSNYDFLRNLPFANARHSSKICTFSNFMMQK